MPVLTTALTPEGPVLTLVIGVSKPRADALLAAGLPVPPPVQIRALIDTGASSTCVEAGALQSLSLVPSGAISMTTPSTGPNPVICNQYDVGVFVVHPVITLGLDTMPIIECQALGGGIQALLGRDFLGLCLFVYDGQAQRFSFGI
jgi:hypothetical protein